MSGAGLPRRAPARRWADAPLRVKGLIVVAIPLIALAISGSWLLLTLARMNEADEAAAATRRAKIDLSLLRFQMAAAENGVRSYLLTDDGDFLTTAREAADQVPGALGEVESFVDEAGLEDHDIPQLRTLVDRRLALFDRLASLPPGLDGPQTQEVLVASARLDEQMGERLDALDADLQDKLVEKAAEERQARQMGLTALLVSGIAGVLGGVAGIYLFTSGVVRRAERMEENARRIDRGEDLLPMPPGDDEIGRVGRQLTVTGALLEERQRELSEARDFLEQLIASSPVLIFRSAPGLALTYVSPNVEWTLGAMPEEILGPDGWLSRVHPDDAGSLVELVEGAVAAREEGVSHTYRVRHRDGTYRWLQTTVSIEYDENGVPTGLIGYALDITERREAEHALAEGEMTLGAIVDTSPDVIGIIEPDGRPVYMSPAIEQVLGYPPGSLADSDIATLHHPDDRRLAAELMRGALATHEALRARYRMRHADGRWVWMDVRARGRSTPGDPKGAEFGDQIVLWAREITAQVELEDELRRAKEGAEQSNRAKSDFLSRMSHELRTPLNAILGFAQILQMDSLTPEQRDSVNEILKGGRHLLDLINEVLDIARIETGRLALSIEPVAIEGVVRESVGLVRPLAGQRGIEISVDANLDPEWHVMADRQRLKQVLLNLLSNAVKYNRPRGRVRLSCEMSEPDVLRLSVSDTGPGIDPALMDLLFSPFERLGAERTAVEGTGLGLALSKRLVESMGGTIEVMSSLGAGSMFTIELAVAEGPVERLKRSGEERPIVLPHPDESRTLLYIEDNLSNLRLVEHLLSRRSDITLHATMQGRLGLDLAREHRPDLVLLDLNLPDMAGGEVLALLRSDPSTSDIPVVVISADATSHQIDRLMKAGAFAYLTKPLDVHRFLSVVERSLQETRARATDDTSAGGAR